VNVRVHTDRGLVECQSQHQVSGFPADPVQLEQRLLVRGHQAAVFIQERATDVKNLAGFYTVKTSRVDRPCDPARGQPEHGLGRAGQPVEPA